MKFCCEESNYKMTTTQNVILRVAIVLGMMVAVVAILYLTPLPEKHFKSCDRPCHDMDWPMICRVKLVIEKTENNSIIINRQTPGPSIHICQNDVLVVDVINKIQGHSLSVHWRGQLNNEAPYMDGVSLVTQCPINSYSTFQYKFRVSTSGTHLYHAHSDRDRTRGLFGALVVREPEKYEVAQKHYDFDSKNHTILITSDNKINGKGLEVFKVRRNRRYRFRAINVGGEIGCPVTLSVDNHSIKVIALDGNLLDPLEVDSLVFGKGERVDFILKTNKETRDYFLRVKSCKGDGLALISYEGSRRKSEELVELKKTRFDTAFCKRSLDRVCLNDVKGLEKIPEKLEKEVEKVVYLSFGSRIVNVNDKFTSKFYGINNLTFTYPPSPLLTQLNQISLSSVCDELNVPEKCRKEDVCECVHVEYIPLGASIELILINQDDEEHVFHFHGYRFYVVGYKQFTNLPQSEEIKLLDKEKKLFERNLDRPIAKDTIRVSEKSVVGLRFEAINPGFWMFRDEKSKGWTRGMDIVFQVGDSADMVSAPTDFPTCGNYIGPDFFLM